MKLILLLLIFTSCKTNREIILKKITGSIYETKTISNGKNSPAIDITKDSLDLFLIALHYKMPYKEIAEYLKWDNLTKKRNTDILIKNGLLKAINNVYVPTLGIFPIEKGKKLIEKSHIISNQIAESIKVKLDVIKGIHSNLGISKNYSFYDLSFFYIIDILLDMGQINNVEKEFLREERPLRNGNLYYCAILEKDTTKNTEPFGIYGNQGLLNNDTIYLGVYGNTRTESNIGWRDYENKEIHYFSKNDFDILINQMPNIILPTLISILERNKSYIKKTYTELGYDEEMTFNEFFIWWYHFIYSETTNKLIKDNIIKKPKNGLLYYKIQK